MDVTGGRSRTRTTKNNPNTRIMDRSSSGGVRMMERLMSGLNWKRRGGKEKEVIDGSRIEELVGNERVFGSYIDHKFQELDRDADGKLSVKELQPAVADIGAAIGLQPQGSSPDSDQIYCEVLKEFTHGKEEEEVSKTEFREVLSDILLGMAAGLNRDPIVILRLDGEDLREYVESQSFEIDAIATFSEMESESIPMHRRIVTALEQLTVDLGMPPASDHWVASNIITPAMDFLSEEQLEQPASQETFLVEFKKVVKRITQHIEEHLVIVAHTEKTFDGSIIKKLLSEKFKLEKCLNTTWRSLPKGNHKKMCREYLRAALDEIAPSAGLPPYGAVEQIDAIFDEAIKLVETDHGKPMNEEEFKKIMKEMLGSIMLQLMARPISVSSNTVVHEPFASSSSTLAVNLPASVSDI